MGGSSVLGFAMRSMATARKMNHVRSMAAITRRFRHAEESADSAAARPGAWVRRGLVVSIVFATILAPFILGYTDTPIVYQYVENVKGLLALILGGQGKEIVTFRSIDGYLITDTMEHCLAAIFGFYFGQGIGK